LDLVRPCHGKCVPSQNGIDIGERFFKCPDSDKCVRLGRFRNVEESCGIHIPDKIFPRFRQFNFSCPFVCSDSDQCILQTDYCNGKLDCLDRSDEENCRESDFDYSDLQICTNAPKNKTYDVQAGFVCGSSCVSVSFWCFTFVSHLSYYETFLECPHLLRSLNNVQLCRNMTFWSSIPKEYDCEERCRGNFPGQCYGGENMQNFILCKNVTIEQNKYMSINYRFL
jgi:hypothetical protein